jgi:hypothetical protein
MGLDLRHLRPQLNELLLVDTCEIHQDPLGATNDVTDPVTGAVTTAGSTLVVSTDCKLKGTFRNLSVNESGTPTTVGYYELSIPQGVAADVRPGMHVKMLTSVHDPSAVGKWFRVAERLHSTFSLFMKFRVELRERPYDRP